MIDTTGLVTSAKCGHTEAEPVMAEEQDHHGIAYLDNLAP